MILWIVNIAFWGLSVGIKLLFRIFQYVQIKYDSRYSR